MALILSGIAAYCIISYIYDLMGVK